MRILSIALIFTLVLTGCNYERSADRPLLNYIPSDASAIVKINRLSSFQSALKNNSFLNENGDVGTFNNMNKALDVLAEINSDTTNLIAYVERDTTRFLYITYDHPSWSIGKDSTVTDSLNAGKIIPVEIGESIYFTSARDNKRFVSSSEELIEEALSNSNSNEVDIDLSRLYKSASSQKSSSFFLNTRNRSTVFSSIFEYGEKESGNLLSDWVTYDLNLGQQYLYLNGLAQARDTTHSFLRLFSGTNPVPSITPELATPQTDAIIAYTFDDYETFTQNQSKYLDSPYSINTDFTAADEVGLIFQNGSTAAVIRSYGSESVQSFLDGQRSGSREYQAHEIISLSKNDFLEEAFQPLLNGFKAKHYTIIDNVYVFSESISLLESLIANYNSKTSFTETSTYQAAKNALVSESSVLLISTSELLEKAATGYLSGKLIQEIDGTEDEDYVFSSQIKADEDFFHTHFSINKITATEFSGTTAPLFTIKLDNEVATDPQFVINHRTRKKEIIVQDTENNLYLISTEGKVLWKKQLEAQIQGKVQQVDLYKNGRLQLAFTTSNQFIILDRNGKEVGPFNKNYPGGNLNPLSVFDYDKNRNYRFVVTQGTNVFMYNQQGNIVSGFTYTDAESPILDGPDHIRIGKRDYLTFKLENGTLKILNRLGKDRIKLKDPIQFSGNGIHLYRDKFILTDRSGDLISIDTDGNLKRTKLNLNEDHGMDATIKTLVTLNENTLTIKGRSKNIDLGVYLDPHIFYIHDKIYVSTTDIQSGLVNLFDSSNNPIPNFPVFGNSNIDMADIDNDGRPELVTKDQDSSLIIYSIR